MTEVQRVFFGLFHVLIDPECVRGMLPSLIGGEMARRYGETTEFWSAAYEQVRADWDSYYADLDLAGDDGVADMWEGMFRTTRALFRLAGKPEPPKDELTALSRSLMGRSVSRVCCGYEDAREAVHWLCKEHAASIVVHAPLSAHTIVGFLLGCDLRGWVTRIMGLESTRRFRPDVTYWQIVVQRAFADPARCIVIDTLDESIDGAQAAGMRAYRFTRTPDANLRDFVERVLTE